MQVDDVQGTIPRTGYSMASDGFYMTLRKRVVQMLKEKTGSKRITMAALKADWSYQFSMWVIFGLHTLFWPLTCYLGCTTYIGNVPESTRAHSHY